MTLPVAAEAALWTMVILSAVLLGLAAAFASRERDARASVVSTIRGLGEFSVAIANARRTESTIRPD